MKIILKALRHDGTLKRTWTSYLERKIDKEIVCYTKTPLYVMFPSGERKRFPYQTREYFFQDTWFNVLEQHINGTISHWYVNIASPPTFQDNSLSYIDYDLDFVIQPDYSITEEDRDEFDLNKAYYPIDHRIEIEKAIKDIRKRTQQRLYPFQLR
ncbi:hypothetical protein A2973_01675 [Candidatus Gottesmanbacteria bacterium RIFCSPLOWO2_01_FULL_49_10]|uniref:DUF402 domain-containing protein n=1 Tax=Candidatus Gottesmanbacteria bacterium RIFCSPLOWO2_01_FULL_49_10 TaxID=1798396 RepID=A0A1F6AXX9_9BACT|nr:MAG: hypothetical protein UY10_C0012G0011 [Microgenomates group bacterium GW2011_GWA2_47_8]OGG29177.1 MAG: hypothetical protein A2973_01675 [Candidatus Gottesmanbacteria bacterium RIFCSPLOWO2_01_FULL_49_10]